MNIPEIKKAAEAATKGPYMVAKGGMLLGTEMLLGPDNCRIAEFFQCAPDEHYFAMLDPATVLELCRLAEIGRQKEQDDLADELASFDGTPLEHY